MPAKSHAVIDGPFDRNPALSMSTTFYVNERGGSTGTGPFTCSTSQPFISAADMFKEDILGENPDLLLVAEMPGLSQYSAMHDNMREFHEG